MYRPSGITVVTAGLAGIALFSVVWSHGAKPPDRSPRNVSADGLPDLGAPIRLQSGAWRSSAALAGEETPLAVPDQPPAPQASAVLPASEAVMMPSAAPTVPAAVPEPVESGAVREAHEQAKAASDVPNQDTVEAKPAPPAKASEPTSPPVSERPSTGARMRLAGPKAEAPEPPPSPARGSEPAVRERERQVEAPPQSAPKFGPAIFKEIDRNGGF